MADNDTRCASCGFVMTDESPSDDLTQRKPCTQCASLARVVSLHAHCTVHVTASAKISVITHPQTLLATCKGLIEDGQHAISVVVAHMACEVATERSLSAAFAAKGLQYLEDPVLDFLNGYNLGNDRNRKLYTALTNDNIEQQPFWPEFKVSTTRRNNVVHNSVSVSKSESERSFQAASAFVVHLKQ